MAIPTDGKRNVTSRAKDRADLVGTVTSRTPFAKLSKALRRGRTEEVFTSNSNVVGWQFLQVLSWTS
ncbi:hypothetical protein BC826DRAFT_1161530 [Russula brevipes]|nr:hypothetical protein BC826DRAFT_1161530 [Russula brevipes]